jgi:hypothetical protein
VLARLDKPLRRNGVVKDGKSVIGGGLLLRSLLEMSRNLVRGIEAMPVEATGVA